MKIKLAILLTAILVFSVFAASSAYALNDPFSSFNSYMSKLKSAITGRAVTGMQVAATQYACTLTCDDGGSGSKTCQSVNKNGLMVDAGDDVICTYSCSSCSSGCSGGVCTEAAPACFSDSVGGSCVTGQCYAGHRVRPCVGGEWGVEQCRYDFPVTSACSGSQQCDGNGNCVQPAVECSADSETSTSCTTLNCNAGHLSTPCNGGKWGAQYCKTNTPLSLKCSSSEKCDGSGNCVQCVPSCVGEQCGQGDGCGGVCPSTDKVPGKCGIPISCAAYGSAPVSG